MISNGNTNDSNDKASNGNIRKRNNENVNKGDNSSNNKNRSSNGDRNLSAKSKANDKTNTSAGRNSNNSVNKNNAVAPRKKRYNNNRNNRNANQKTNVTIQNHNNFGSNNHENSGFFEKFATWVSKAAGSTTAFLCAMLIVLGWAVSGPFFDFSETWQLVINTGTTIITFLMVFLIQKAQNKDSLAIQLKLNELVASHAYSSNRLVDIEHMTEEEMKVIQKYYERLSEFSKKDEKLQTSHSIEEAEDQHELKSSRRAKRYKSKDNDKD